MDQQSNHSKTHFLNNSNNSHVLPINALIPPEISQIDELSVSSQHSYRLGLFINQKTNQSSNSTPSQSRNLNPSQFNPRVNPQFDHQANSKILNNQEKNKTKNRNTSFANKNFLEVNINSQEDLADQIRFQNQRNIEQQQNIYKIKVRGPQKKNIRESGRQRERQNCRLMRKQSQGIYQKSEQQSKQQNSQNLQKQLQSEQDENLIITPQHFPLQVNITGYQIHVNQQISEQQITQAFKVIDVDKDNLISEEDIAFFLEYLKQPFTYEEVKQMIDLAVQDSNRQQNGRQALKTNTGIENGGSLSNSKRKVAFDDFKRISKGAIIPLAHYRVPDAKWKNKGKILDNIKSSELYNLDCPKKLIKAIKTDQNVSYQDFQLTKQLNENMQTQKIKPTEEFEDIKNSLLIRGRFDFKRRKQQFSGFSPINIKEALDNYYQDFQNKQIKYHQVAKILEINDKQAKQLYGTAAFNSKIVILEAIAFSTESKFQKLQWALDILTTKKTTNLGQLLHIIQFLKGQDQTMLKKLLNVYYSKKINRNQDIKKYYALELFRQFNGIIWS